MELSVFLNSLRDPMGLPFYPLVFQVLMVLTFALHIFAVNVVVGSLLLAIFGWIRKSGDHHRLAKVLIKVATITTSVAVVLGVAPLLFIQVIYDPLWYTANRLSAWWAMIFLFFIMLGFLLAYVSYLGHDKRSGISLPMGVLSLALIVSAGVIMHMLNMESLLPQFWSEWFAGGDQLATSGWAFKSFSFGRFGHFMIPAVINVGVFLMLYGWYGRKKPGGDVHFLERIAATGAVLTRFGLLVQVGFGLWWLLALPGQLRFLANPGFHFGVTVAVVVAGLLFWTTASPSRRAPLTALLSLIAILAMSITREALRSTYLGQFDYTIYNYPVNLDWGSTVLFFSTFVIGLIVLSYPLLVAFRAGQGEDV